jgi:uncharacterized protein (DUF362 family)
LAADFIEGTFRIFYNHNKRKEQIKELSVPKSKVAVLFTSPEKVDQDYARLFDLAGMKQALDASKPTIIKPNISWHYFFPGANTTPWQMDATLKYLKDNNFKDVTAVENETVVTNAFKGEKLNKFTPAFKKYGVKVLYNFRESDIKWVPFTPKAKMIALPSIFPEGIFVPDFFVGKNIVHLPTVKCHIYTGTTGAMKNAFGGLLTKKRHYTHSVIHETLVDLLAIQKEIHPGLFAVMDGTIAGNGPGPRTMTPVNKGVILASADQVAIDAVAAKMMGLDPMSLKYIRIATEHGLGNGEMANIEIVGDDCSKENWGFEAGNNAAAVFIKPFWFNSWLSRFQKVFFHTPLVYFFVFGSFFFHDIMWYPTKGKARTKEWLKTDWGKKWLTYPEA